ncbi:hypothetical protein [Kordiimonas pumila]|uniref:Uncharacterized protein n=1 Tax=Kordiimonas pumila TaxID=2161677 RepID=A0ABV7D7K2_9PROT|nr:hypothetical protein [Kordiimonas pumila]
MKHFFKHTVSATVMIFSLGAGSAVLADAPKLMLAQYNQQADREYARELAALIKRQQQEWDAMIEEQSNDMTNASTDADRSKLAMEHRKQRKEMEQEHKEQIADLKEDHKSS